MANVIKFSHPYPKLWGQKQATLLDVRIIHSQKLSNDLVEYDTKISLGKYYKLPKDGFLIQLIFLGDKQIPFCTLRKYDQAKLAFYKGLRGQSFEVKMTEEE